MLSTNFLLTNINKLCSILVYMCTGALAKVAHQVYVLQDMFEQLPELLATQARNIFPSVTW
jgi:hypothetical protein